MWSQTWQFQPWARSAQHSGQNNNREHDGEYEKQAAGLVSGVPLVTAGGAQVLVSTSGVVSCADHVVRDYVEGLALLVHHVCDVAEEFVQLADRLLDVANFGFTLDNEGLLEIDLGLVCQTELLLLLLLQLLAASLLARVGLTALFQGCSCSGRGCALLVECLSLQSLELSQGRLELLVQFALGVFLGWLSQAVSKVCIYAPAGLGI